MRKIKRIRAILLVFVIISFVYNKALSQPGKMSKITYFEKYVKYAENRSSAINIIHNLRLQLSDTLFIEQNSQDTSWLIRHREATYVNFLCFLYESKLTGGNSCLLLLGKKNYSMFYKYRDLSQFPEPGQYESEYAELTYLLKSICINEYKNSAFNTELISDSACGCRGVIKELKKEQDEKILAAEKAERNRIHIEITQRKIQTQDSLRRLKEKIVQEPPIYLANGVLRVDSTCRIKSKDLDTLNILLVHEMLRASNRMFSHYINNCASENVEIMLDVLIKNGIQCIWLIKLKKINGILSLLDDIPLEGLENRMMFKLISEFYLSEISRYVEENEVLVLPFKIYRNHYQTNNKTVEHKIEDGFIHVILPVINLNLKELVPYMTPEEYENSEFERKRTTE